MSYVPIKDANNNNICDVSNNNANVVPNCSDHDIYRMEEVILKQLNQFNLEYSNYKIYSYNKQHSSPGDLTKKYKYIDADEEMISRFPNIENSTKLPSYTTLIQNLTTYNDVLAKYKENNPDPINKNEKDVKNNNSELSNRDPTTYLKPRHNEILRLRSDLDQKLMDLNNTSNGMYSSSKLQMDSNIYITIMWTTLASAIVYYSFFHL
jgi:hypothetical protein